MIQFENVYFKYKQKSIYENLNLEIKLGEKVAILGHNGAGKTTLVKLMSGLLKPYKYQKFEYSKSASIVLSNNQLYSDLNAFENLSLFLKMYKKKKSKEEINNVIRQVGLEEYKQKSIKELSTGYKQRVNIAKTILLETDLVILDEPTSGLDPMSTKNIINLINKSYGNQNQTVILCSHNMEEVISIASRIVFLKNGEIIFDKQIEELHEILETEVYIIKSPHKLNIDAIVHNDGIDNNHYYFGDELPQFENKVDEIVRRRVTLTDIYILLECDKGDKVINRIVHKK